MKGNTCQTVCHISDSMLSSAEWEVARALDVCSGRDPHSFDPRDIRRQIKRTLEAQNLLQQAADRRSSRGRSRVVTDDDLTAFILEGASRRRHPTARRLQPA